MSEASTHPHDPAAAEPNASAARFRLSPAEWLWLPIVGAALLLIYLPGLDNNLVYDDSYLTEGLFAEYASMLQLRVRMLAYGSFVWMQAVFGEDWWKQRLLNLILHIGVVLSLWALYREILRHVVASADDPAGATPLYQSPALGLAVGFFALNPVAVYAVAYLIQRSIVMATLFTVLALWLFARGLRQGKWYLHALAVICYALAVLSKEHAILAPLAAVPLYILVERPSARRLAVLAVGGGVLVALAAGLLYRRYGEILGTPFDEYSHLYLDQLSRINPDARRNAFLLSILNEAWLFFRYGVDWLLPYSGWMSISIRPPFPVHWLTFPQILGIGGYVALLVGGFVLLFRYRDARALLGLSLLFPALLFPTEFSTVWVQDPFSLYRSYLWAIGVPGLVFFALHGPSPRVLLAVGGVLGALLVWQAMDRVRSMATPESAWTDAIRKLPDDARSVGRWFPYLNRGSAYAEQNLFNLALRDFENSAALGDQGMGMFNAGSILSAQGRHTDALAAFDRAQKEGYKAYNLPFQRGLALLALGRVEEAYREMEATLAQSPASPTREIALLHLGRAGMQLGKREEPARALEQLVALEPRHKEGRYLLGMASVMNGNPARAREVLDALVQEDPSARAHYARALANYALRRKPEALADIERARRLGADNPNLREWEAKIRALP
jgi:protein O-mannosyl-transferase